MFRFIEAEVAGGMGDKTVVDMSVHPPIVHKLDYQFEGWLGDDILETFPCYIVTDRLRQEIEKLALTGVSFDNTVVSTSETFEKLYPSRILPKFYWLKVLGTPRKDDFGMAEDYKLMISDTVFTMLKNFNVSNASFQVDK